MDSFKETHASLARLAERVVAGEVVFFVGAGTSLDSERNSGPVLIARLLARFEALHRVLQELPNSEPRRHAEVVYRSMQQTFRLEPKPDYLKPEYIETLARDYYVINDWMCGALEDLIRIASNALRKRGSDPDGFVAAVLTYEKELFERWRREAKQPEWVPGPGEIDLTGLLALEPGPRTRGKALFLDTMGFTERAVMGGNPRSPDPQNVMSASCGGKPEAERLLPRHFVLARFAREGLLPTLITTNYDLLLESAYRLAGFDLLQATDAAAAAPPGKRAQFLPPTTFEFYDRVASANHFFRRGAVARAPRLVKIHGCADTYRQFRARADAPTGTIKARAKKWEAYLPALVFTYREIQNWREDAWSRDLLRTLLRTRTVVFCGYSGVDPVLHDTFRTVYEEMANQRVRLDVDGGPRHPEDPEPRGGLAPTFFFGLQDRREFHGMQILRAASMAAGDAAALGDSHPNYVGFWPKEPGGKFPNLDELMEWLYHLVLRRRQHEMLSSDLTRIATLLLDHPVPQDEVEEIVKNHQRLCASEVDRAASWQDDHAGRVSFERTIGWTHWFHVGLLRELAIAEDALRHLGPGLRADELRWPWYYPSADHPDWTAWASVVELALRRMIAAWRRDFASWNLDSSWVEVAHTAEPGVMFAHNELRPTPRLITIMAAPGDEFSAPPVKGVFRARAMWKLQPSSIPWLRPSAIDRKTPRDNRQPHGLTPTADVIWSWAWRPDVEQLAQESDGWPELQTTLGGRQ